MDGCFFVGHGRHGLLLAEITLQRVGLRAGFLLGELYHPAHRPTGWKQIGEERDRREVFTPWVWEGFSHWKESAATEHRPPGAFEGRCCAGVGLQNRGGIDVGERGKTFCNS